MTDETKRMIEAAAAAGILAAMIVLGLCSCTTGQVDRVVDVAEVVIWTVTNKPPVGVGGPTNTAPIPTQPKPDAPIVVADNGDELDLSTVAEWILPATPGVRPANVIAAKVSGKLFEAQMAGSVIRSRFEYSFPASDGLDAFACLFYREGGKIRGGKFDWFRTGGQPEKTLKNVRDGYGGHRMPAPGTDTWMLIVSIDGKQRTNTKKVTW